MDLRGWRESGKAVGVSSRGLCVWLRATRPPGTPGAHRGIALGLGERTTAAFPRVAAKTRLGGNSPSNRSANTANDAICVRAKRERQILDGPRARRRRDAAVATSMIWCDLDNTLIWTWEPLITSPLLSVAFGLPMETKPPSGKGLRRLSRVTVPNFGVAHTCIRTNAHLFLAELRRVDSVKMLTSATRPYAEAMNAVFELGFSPDDIVSREILANRDVAGIDPSGVLVDNEAMYSGSEAHDRARAQKLRYLGSQAVVEVHCFRGEINDPFENEWLRYVAQVQAKLPQK